MPCVDKPQPFLSIAMVWLSIHHSQVQLKGSHHAVMQAQYLLHIQHLQLKGSIHHLQRQALEIEILHLNFKLADK